MYCILAEYTANNEAYPKCNKVPVEVQSDPLTTLVKNYSIFFNLENNICPMYW